MLLAQTRRDCKETRVHFCMRIEYGVLVGVCVYNAMQCCFVNLQNGRTQGRLNTRYAMLFAVLSTYKMAAWTYIGQCAL